MNRFEKQTAIVTGAGSGLGHATAARLAAEGAAVACLDVLLSCKNLAASPGRIASATRVSILGQQSKGFPTAATARTAAWQRQQEQRQQ